MLKRTAAFFILAAMIIGVFILPVSASEGGKSDDIVILFTNDVHCGIDDNIGYDGLALYKREMQEKYENVYLVDAGDAIQGATIGTLSDGAYITELMNEVGYDAAVPGNHEFDYGMSELMLRAEELNCGYISSNFYDKITGKLLFEPYRLINAGEKKIAFVGATTPESLIDSDPTHFQNKEKEYIYGFGEDGTIYELIQNAVDEARANGADYVILLAHLGESGIREGWSAPEIVAKLTGVDALIDGHSHEETPGLTVSSKDGKDVVIAQTGTKLANIGKMVIKNNGQIITSLINSVPAPEQGSNITDDMWLEPEGREGRYVDRAIYGVIERIHSDLSDIFTRKIGSSDFELYVNDPETGNRRVRLGETNIGDFCADAFRYMLGAEVGIENGGGIRKGISAGDITYNDIMSLMPFGNMMVLAEVTGQQILDILEIGAMKYPLENGSLIHVSGIEYTIDESVESSVQLGEFGDFLGVPGEYRVKDVRINGEPLDPDRLYTLASHDYYLINGGDGWVFSGKCRILREYGQSDFELVAAYVRDYLGGSIPEEYRDPYGQGRIKIISSGDEAGQNNPNTGDHIPAVLVIVSLALAAALIKKRRSA